MKFKVDVKAFLSVTVEADTLEGAVEEAKAFVEGLDPGHGYLDGWNSARAQDEALQGRRVIEHGSLDCEDPPYVEDEDGNELEPGQ